ncbi:hypothetical protein CS022_08675 [Veronia nyctiphanis]|uniref:Uncharacterized protein n=1 Tax=Veronia nyctiphanis TaxID=1278244 RepID=A0A4Q0YWJ0_9GAMM|nr:hypothetical protein [Veronia nyctiphanis]RXJ73569.1 hypothetical protein CS022_08675 [Veronia nyctiphanis]
MGLKAEQENTLISQAIKIKNTVSEKAPQTENQERLENLKRHALKQAIAKTTPILSLFMQNDLVRFALLNKNNQATWDYWLDIDGNCFIDQIFSMDRLTHLNEQQEMLIYCFSHQEEASKYYFCANAEELPAEYLFRAWQLAATRESWRVFRVKLEPFLYLKDNMSNSSLH